MTTGVVLMAYGTPRHRDEILPYYTDIRRGRPPSDEQLADLTSRYDAIGGLSPLAQRTEAQRDAIQGALDAIEPGGYRVAVGLKHADPKIEATVAELIGEGHDRLVGLVLAPHYSAASVGQYLDRARRAAGSTPVSAVESWAIEPAFVEFLSADVARCLEAMPDATRVVFTAHSLPLPAVAGGDPYPDELLATATAVADRVGLGERWSTAWQSAGRTPDPWLGPDILEVIDALGRDPEASSVLVCACGFVADHLEVLYDLDIEARQRATRAGLGFDRTASVDADPEVMAALARRIHDAED